MPDETNPDSADTVTVAAPAKGKKTTETESPKTDAPKKEAPDPATTIAARCVKRGVHVNDVPQDKDLTVQWVLARIRTKARGAALLATQCYEATADWPDLPDTKPAK